ncbi:apn-1 [Cordylochernes scorpioides]|uniref:Apn-1 n=1 Tax=Cordylochernes scorpioides TaxID=51811 RepID=A0ABY6KEA6_9ARAC|nr:apn-1 [Cordylochernes scorpioides]
MDRSDLLHGQDTTTTSVGWYCDLGTWTDLICSMDKTPPPPQLTGTMRPTRSRLSLVLNKENSAALKESMRTLTSSLNKRMKGTPRKPSHTLAKKIKSEEIDALEETKLTSIAKRTKKNIPPLKEDSIKDEAIPQKSKKLPRRSLKAPSQKILQDIKIKQEPLLEDGESKPQRRRKVKVEDAPSKRIKTEEDEAMMVKSPSSFPWRDSKKYIGAHVSIAGGLENAVTNAVEIGARAFALFLTSQRTWSAKPLEPKTAERFKTACAAHGYPPHLIIPHGSYLLNCGSPNPEVLAKSRAKLTDELQRCEMLGLQLYNFHPGSTCGEIPVEQCVAKISESINLALEQTRSVTAVVENMSCQGHTIGGKFSQLRAIIDGVKDKSRVGVCIDTCHAFAAGYNLATKEGFHSMMEEFESVVGLQYLKALHINDSKGKLGCHLDRHENIGRGHIGKQGFTHLMQDPRFNNLPLILETPVGLSDAEEINILHGLE